MNIWQQKTPVIAKLRVKGEKVDALAARLHFERLFGAADFLPEGLPPKAIVCIKNLRDPAPGTLRLSRADSRPADAWRNCVAREIEKLFRRAFRPIRETVPAQAESIVFADNSELLACLASDWSEGLLARRWWWRSLFPDLQRAQTVARIWIEAAEFAPTALQFLAKQRKAVKFVTLLQPAETSDLLRRIIRVFGLNKLETVLLESFEERKEFFSVSAAPFQSSALWSGLIAEAQHPALNFQQQCLLGIGLLLARSPRIVRSAEFTRRAKIFRTEFKISRTAAPQGIDKIPTRTETSEIRREKIEKSSWRREKPKSPPVLTESEVETKNTPEKKAAQIFENSASFAEEAVKASGSFVNAESEIKPPPLEKTQETAEKISFENSQIERFSGGREIEKRTKSFQDEAQIFLPTASSEIFEETEPDFEFVVETRFGGVFYLLNLGLYLNLYRDFTEPAGTEIDLNVWDFVALLALEFLGRKIKDDAVWTLLARLAGRENEEELGQGFAPPDEWRMPPEWLETFQTNRKWLWLKTGGRLVVRHPAGFSVIDVPLGDDPENQLENELKIYEKNFFRLAKGDSKNFSERFSPSVIWLKNLAEYARKRLLQALNLPTPKQINRILFERPAKITVTATHFDAVFSLADLPLEVRLSGLDRNPAWIPAAGKFVKFHFI
jgi:hypothetical protein